MGAQEDASLLELALSDRSLLKYLQPGAHLSRLALDVLMSPEENLLLKPIQEIENTLRLAFLSIYNG